MDENDDRRGERLAALFLLGISLFNPLFIGIFGDEVLIRKLGIPSLYVYVFSAWGVLILLMAVIVEFTGSDGRKDESEQTDDANRAA